MKNCFYLFFSHHRAQKNQTNVYFFDLGDTWTYLTNLPSEHLLSIFLGVSLKVPQVCLSWLCWRQPTSPMRHVEDTRSPLKSKEKTPGVSTEECCGKTCSLFECHLVWKWSSGWVKTLSDLMSEKQGEGEKQRQRICAWFGLLSFYSFLQGLTKLWWS